MSVLASRRSGQCGSAYVEVLVAVMLVMVCLVPALDALQNGIGSTNASEQYVKHKNKMNARMLTLLVESFSVLDAEALITGGSTVASSLFSEPAGSPDRILVYVYRYDGDNADLDNNPDTGGDAGLLMLRVAMQDGDFDISTLITE